MGGDLAVAIKKAQQREQIALNLMKTMKTQYQQVEKLKEQNEWLKDEQGDLRHCMKLLLNENDNLKDTNRTLKEENRNLQDIVKSLHDAATTGLAQMSKEEEEEEEETNRPRLPAAFLTLSGPWTTSTRGIRTTMTGTTTPYGNMMAVRVDMPSGGGTQLA